MPRHHCFFFKTSLGYWEPILGYSGCQSIIELGSMQFLGKFVDRGCQLECLGDSLFTPLQDTPDHVCMLRSQDIRF